MARIVGPNNPFALQRIAPSRTFERSPQSQTISEWGSPKAFPAVNAIGGIIAGTVGTAIEKRAIREAALARVEDQQRKAAGRFEIEEGNLLGSADRGSTAQLQKLQADRARALEAQQAGSKEFLGFELRRPDVERKAIEDELYSKSYDRALALAASASHETDPQKALELRAAAARAAASAWDRPRGGSLTDIMAGAGEERVTEDLKRLYPQVDLRERKHAPRGPGPRAPGVSVRDALETLKLSQGDNVNVRILNAANEWVNSGKNPTETMIQIPGHRVGFESTEPVWILTPTAEQTRQLSQLPPAAQGGIYRSLYDAAESAKRLEEEDRKKLNKSLQGFQTSASQYSNLASYADRDNPAYKTFWDDKTRIRDRGIWSSPNWAGVLGRLAQKAPAEDKPGDKPVDKPGDEPAQAGVGGGVRPAPPDAGPAPAAPDSGMAPQPRATIDAGATPLTDAGAARTPQDRREAFRASSRRNQIDMVKELGMARLDDSTFYSADDYPRIKARVDELMRVVPQHEPGSAERNSIIAELNKLLKQGVVGE
tara:strand:- start:491 stop:2113 length:1623 start_codon:yes stop_codon:yes gene_type:complete